MNLIETLKQNQQDFEFYPTTKEMLFSCYNNMKNTRDLNKFLDIGSGNGTFKKYVAEYNQKFNDKFNIDQYMVIEKSPILLNQLSSDDMIVGTDFYQTNLIDKSADVVFCNPPYSDYENWVCKILSQVTAKEFYFVIPDRWKNSDLIKSTLDKFKKYHRVIFSGDFLNAERSARAKIEVVYFWGRPEENQSFNFWFDETFKFQEPKKEEKETDKIRNNKEIILNKNLVETLLKLYDEEMQKIFSNYNALSSLDYSLFSELNISIKTVRQTLRERLANTKNTYWNLLFNNLDQINEKLTFSSRRKFLEKIKTCGHVDFTKENIAAVLGWILKNAEKYYNDQIVDLFRELSIPDCIKNYKSNQKTFQDEKWRWNANEHMHYTLDYRIVTENYKLKKQQYSFRDWECHKFILDRIQDVVTVANNLGFSSKFEVLDERKVFEYGVKQYVHKNDGGILFEFKVFQNGNVHYKFDIEFCKALNVEAGRLLGWIKNKSDIKSEFPEQLKDADIYFGTAIKSISNFQCLMIGN